MSLYIFAKLKIHDRDLYNRYMEKARGLFVEHGVKIPAASENMHFHNSEKDCDKVVLMEFRDPEHMQSFMSNPEYVAAAKDRDAGAEVQSITFEGIPPLS